MPTGHSHTLALYSKKRYTSPIVAPMISKTSIAQFAINFNVSMLIKKTRKDK